MKYLRFQFRPFYLDTLCLWHVAARDVFRSIPASFRKDPSLDLDVQDLNRRKREIESLRELYSACSKWTQPLLIFSSFILQNITFSFLKDFSVFFNIQFLRILQFSIAQKETQNIFKNS